MILYLRTIFKGFTLSFLTIGLINLKVLNIYISILISMVVIFLIVRDTYISYESSILIEKNRDIFNGKSLKKISPKERIIILYKIIFSSILFYLALYGSMLIEGTFGYVFLQICVLIAILLFTFISLKSKQKCYLYYVDKDLENLK
ncbi:hypothetical protein [Metabacillus niabensis]|uniref:hypothetical protein n=1 Tax=Metabacillus niabensis TaxID=324854 RepID=UPI0039A16B44